MASMSARMHACGLNRGPPLTGYPCFRLPSLGTRPSSSETTDFPLRNTNFITGSKVKDITACNVQSLQRLVPIHQWGFTEIIFCEFSVHCVRYSVQVFSILSCCKLVLTCYNLQDPVMVCVINKRMEG